MVEIADVFNKYGDIYKKKNKIPLSNLKVIKDIRSCRTTRLGGHVDICDSCGHIRISYNSCRNRHCPKCQGLKKKNG